MIKTTLVALLLSSIAFSYELPNPSLTPGDTNPVLTKELICSPSFRTGPYRKVTLSEKKKGFAQYGIDFATRKNYEFDHLISLEIGGSNDLKNLWPQPLDEAKVKDKLENALHRKLCSGEIDLKEAQDAIAKDWVLEYQKVMEEAESPAVSRPSPSQPNGQ